MDPLTLPTLLKRLEAATSRLEDIAMAQAPPTGALSGASAVHGNIASSHIPPPPAVVTEQQRQPLAVAGFSELIDGPLAKYLSLSEQIGGLVALQSTFVAQAFAAQKEFITFASQCTKLAPNDPLFAAKLTPTREPLEAAMNIDVSKLSRGQMALIKTVADGIPALGWVGDETPAPWVQSMKDAAMYYSNQVLRDNKDSNPKAVEWVRSFNGLLDELRAYVKQHHTTGLVWNPKGIDPATYQSSSASASGPPAPPPPPPPPAPPAPGPPPVGAPPAAPVAPAGDMANVFAALNKGEDITKGLKKVDKSEMTHKNPDLRASSVVSATIPASGKAPVKPPKPSSFQKKPSKCSLDGTKWTIENYENDNSIVVNDTELFHVVDIFNVKSSVVHIKGKVNAISLLNCSKISILLDSTVSSLAISNSPSFTVQITGKVPTILVDGCDSGQIYLSKESLDVEIVTAKSSAINVSLPLGDEGDFVEKAVPEQLKTVVKNGKLVTTVMEHSG